MKNKERNILNSVLILIDPQNAFFHVCISEGEGERMEQFVDFCEDAIFEMQISTALSGDDGEVAKVCQNIRASIFLW